MRQDKLVHRIEHWIPTAAPRSSSAPTKPSESQYPKLSAMGKERVLGETKKLLTDHRTAPIWTFLQEPEEGRDMSEDEKKARKKLAGLRPFIHYRNPQDDPIIQAFQKVVAERKAAGEPLFQRPKSEPVQAVEDVTK